jgi:hypothetical protein
MKMDVGVSLPKVAIVAISVVVVLVLALLAWIGGELHYQGCLQQAELQSSAEPKAALVSQATPGSGCSRLPF